jgi:hypothetical protein
MAGVIEFLELQRLQTKGIVQDHVYGCRIHDIRTARQLIASQSDLNVVSVLEMHVCQRCPMNEKICSVYILC